MASCPITGIRSLHGYKCDFSESTFLIGMKAYLYALPANHELKYWATCAMPHQVIKHCGSQKLDKTDRQLNVLNMS